MLAGIIATSAVIALGWVGIGWVTSQAEDTKYEVISAHDNIEIRRYPSLLVAETETQGEREAAINQGFKLIASYIFGNNISAEKIAMTTPVMQQSSEKIAMTTPVTQQSRNGKWLVRFVMPAKYNLENIPKPINPEVRLVEVPSKLFATIRFSGLAGKASLESHTQLLQTFIEQSNYQAINDPAYAFYNPPWTPPFMRRNEVQLEITEKDIK